jgi:NAD(P)-dependent dehydrogenase (short-subunit alcohol dehydrogenase family)
MSLNLHPQDGLETMFVANHLSHFLLTNLLLPELEKTG